MHPHRAFARSKIPLQAPSHVSGSVPRAGQLRDPWREWAFAIVTLGIHAAVGHFRLNRELRDFGVDVDPFKALLTFFPGGLLVIPLLVTVYRTAQRIGVVQETTGLSPSIQPELSVLAAPLAFLHIPYQQAELNRAWRADVETQPKLNAPIDRGVNP